ncbi:kunitz-type U19-barytoxin-Tl1a-like [Microcaecilia unicolor]|uniref:Kunitz-type U19-barytoxin-Tl1a-like n=1 Tax=Microcaecilia unicolor TaxID=1415580 RepID=A0A6P7WYM8_9AMPH|nr:kunitz-type U19-barytoxin-Tl1a-like [Microcaecilia unicolor]
MKNCSTLAEKLYPDDDRVCQLEKDVGDCKGHCLLWAFNHNLKTCEKSFYGGCGGNGNRFFTKKLCYERCAPEKEHGLENDLDSDDVDIGLILGVTIGCVAAVVLVVALIIFLKNRK